MNWLIEVLNYPVPLELTVIVMLLTTFFTLAGLSLGFFLGSKR
jgi:hypothetical protein